jgi:hypothetical protein
MTSRCCGVEGAGWIHAAGPSSSGGGVRRGRIQICGSAANRVGVSARGTSSSTQRDQTCRWLARTLVRIGMPATRTALPAFSTRSKPRVTDGALVGTAPPVTNNAMRIRSTKICSRRAADRPQRAGPSRAPPSRAGTCSGTFSSCTGLPPQPHAAVCEMAARPLLNRRLRTTSAKSCHGDLFRRCTLAASVAR